ncbi:MAG: hypothetical protein WAT66_11790 [Actinomycetota bacterium]
MRTRSWASFLVAILLLLLLASCAPGSNSLESVPDKGGEVAGFWLGLWQGIISPVTFLISLFSDNVRVYEVHNNGNWYNLGFVIGAGILFGGGFAGTRKKKRH